MSGIYTVQFNGVVAATGVQQDFIEIISHASKQCVLLAWGLSQSTEVGDTQEEGLSLLVKSGQTTTGTGGTVPTPTNNDGAGASSGFTAEVNNTTKATGGTIVTHYAYNWNVRMPFDQVYTEQMQLVFGAGRRITIELATGPADPITLSGYAVVQEIG